MRRRRDRLRVAHERERAQRAVGAHRRPRHKCLAHAVGAAVQRAQRLISRQRVRCARAQARAARRWRAPPPAAPRMPRSRRWHGMRSVRSAALAASASAREPRWRSRSGPGAARTAARARCCRRNGSRRGAMAAAASSAFNSSAISVRARSRTGAAHAAWRRWQQPRRVHARPQRSVGKQRAARSCVRGNQDARHQRMRQAVPGTCSRHAAQPAATRRRGAAEDSAALSGAPPRSPRRAARAPRSHAGAAPPHAGRAAPSRTMSERKAVIKNADMSEDMQQEAIDCSTQARVLLRTQRGG
jgi:hypothetical protein